jgi:hypothetical protein
MNEKMGSGFFSVHSKILSVKGSIVDDFTSQFWFRRVWFREWDLVYQSMRKVRTVCTKCEHGNKGRKERESDCNRRNPARDKGSSKSELLQNTARTRPNGYPRFTPHFHGSLSDLVFPSSVPDEGLWCILLTVSCVHVGTDPNAFANSMAMTTRISSFLFASSFNSFNVIPCSLHPFGFLMIFLDYPSLCGLWNWLLGLWWRLVSNHFGCLHRFAFRRSPAGTCWARSAPATCLWTDSASRLTTSRDISTSGRGFFAMVSAGNRSSSVEWSDQLWEERQDFQSQCESLHIYPQTKQIMICSDNWWMVSNVISSMFISWFWAFSTFSQTLFASLSKLSPLQREMLRSDQTTRRSVRHFRVRVGSFDKRFQLVISFFHCLAFDQAFAFNRRHGIESCWTFSLRHISLLCLCRVKWSHGNRRIELRNSEIFKRIVMECLSWFHHFFPYDSSAAQLIHLTRLKQLAELNKENNDGTQLCSTVISRIMIGKHANNIHCYLSHASFECSKNRREILKTANK